VLGKTFQPIEVQRCVNESSWATTGKAYFYDIMTNSWPIANTIHDDTTHANTLVPLAEEELLVNHLKEMKCIFIKQEKFMEIVNSVQRGSEIDTAYEIIEINSANKETGCYNFYAAVCGDSDSLWFGYRSLQNATFGKYCGATNNMAVGTNTSELLWVGEVLRENQDAGFVAVQQLYQPSALLKMFGYDFPAIDSLPPGIKMCPFLMRNAEEDLFVNFKFPPWYDSYFYKKDGLKGYGEIYDHDTNAYREWHSGLSLTSSFKSSTSPHPSEDDEQSSDLGGPSPNRRNPGSSPLRDSTLELNKSPNGPSPGDERPPKRRRASSPVLIAEVRPPPFQIRTPLGKKVPTLFVLQEFGKCNNVIYTDDDGKDVTCGEPCNLNEQMCHSCRMGLF